MAINYETRTQAYIDVDSSFGTASVNLVDGNLSFNHTDWEFGGGPTAFSLSHVYAGANYNNNQFYTGLNTGNGYGWKTNFDQYLIGDTTGAIYIDASGRKHTFKNSNGTIYDDGGLGLQLTKVNDTGPCKIVTDLVGNTMHFSATGYLCRIDTIFGNSIFVRHNANGSIKEIENGDNVATFTYNSNNLLSSVSYTGASETLNFEYSNGYLTTIKKTIGSSVSIQAQFAYTDNRLSRIYGNDYTDTRVTYSNSKVSQISTCSKSQGTALSYTTFTYTSANEAYATNEQGVKFKYTIHNNGDIVKIEEVIGTALYEVFPDKYPDDKQITDFYLGTSKLDDIASLTRAGSIYLSFDNTSTNANHLTVDDIRATLQSFAKGNSTFDIFYNNKKDRIAGATAESYSFRNKSNGSVLFSYDMLSEITKVYDKNNSLAVTYTTKETFSSGGILAVTTQTLASGSSTDIKQTFTKYNGQTTYTIETDPDNRYNLRTDYGYDNYGNLLSTVKKDINGTLSGTVSSYTAFSSNGEHATSETNERGKTSYCTHELPYNVIKTITSPKNVKKSFNYDAFKEKLTSVSCSTDGKTFTNTINTSNNRMTSVTNATGTYTFAYDSNTGDLTQVTSSSGTVLYKNSFNYSTHTNTKTYHDNSTETTTYDKYGNVSSVTHGGKTASFTYQDKNGTLNSKAKVKTITDGFAGTTNTYAISPHEETQINVNDTSTSGKGSWIKKNYISGSKAISEYLVGGSNRVDTTNDRMLYYTESYDGFGKPISRLNISHNNTFTNTVSIEYEKDRFGRATERHIAAPGSYVTKNYTYADSGTRRVGLISKETSTYSNGNTESRSYTYDDNGNITKIAISGTDGSKTISYT
ncbi:MAG: RHS repeat protein, partial [Clostridia bacterium]|nr:RHS repeat protein [Clostridia bacterium]